MKMGGFNFRELIETNGFRRPRTTSSKSSSSLNMAQLPPEILSEVFEHLEGRDIASVARVCKSFYQASLIDKIWQTRCRKEFKVAIASGLIRTQSPSFSMTFFSKVLNKFGRLMGEWQPEVTHYGGLLEIKYENEKLYGIEWQTTNNLTQLRRNDLFSIGLNEKGQLEFLCLRGYSGPHRCQLTIKNDNSFNAKCLVPDSHRHPRGNEIEYEEWSAQGGLPLNTELLLMKFLHVKNYENSFDFRRLQLPPTPLKPIIKPGFFQGTYGDHGNEIIALTYDQDGVVAKAIKITGDPNIPYGQVTFRVDLRYSIVLNETQQRTMELLMQLPRNSTNKLPQDLPVQPFCVPTDCIEYGVHELPRQCKARFSGYAQCAGHGYTNSSYTTGHWIVFNEDVFAFLFLELSSINVYQRCEIKQQAAINA